MHKLDALGIAIVVAIGASSALVSCGPSQSQELCLETGCYCFATPDWCAWAGCTWDEADGGCVAYQPPNPNPYPPPPGPTGPMTCTSNTQCGNGWYCDNGVCKVSSACAQSSECAPGFYCDVTRSSCEPVPSCGGTNTCATAQPTCPSGEVPTIESGCWTGSCEAISSCDVPPACSAINDEQDCLARSDCLAVYSGIDCTMPDGSACASGDSGCTCASYVFASCQSKS